MNKLLLHLGRNPERSLHLFLKGLGLFVIGVTLVFLGYYQHHLWQLPGIVLIGLGCIVAIWGYVGIFASRLNMIFSRYKR